MKQPSRVKQLQLDHLQGCVNWDDSWLLLKSEIANRRRIKLQNWNNMIFMCKRRNDWSTSVQLLDIMRVNGTKPTLVSYNAVIDICGNTRQIDVAFNVFLDMQKYLKPDVVTYTSLIKACGHAFQIDRACLVFATMIQNQVQPNRITYDVLLSACLHAQIKCVALMMQAGF